MGKMGKYLEKTSRSNKKLDISLDLEANEIKKILCHQSR